MDTYEPKWRCVECGVDDFNKTNMDVGIDDLEVWCCHTVGNGVVNLYKHAHTHPAHPALENSRCAKCVWCGWGFQTTILSHRSGSVQSVLGVLGVLGVLSVLSVFHDDRHGTFLGVVVLRCRHTLKPTKIKTQIPHFHPTTLSTLGVEVC